MYQAYLARHDGFGSSSWAFITTANTRASANAASHRGPRIIRTTGTAMAT